MRKYLKRLVGERGFEPPTPWSRTRCSTRLGHSPTENARARSFRRVYSKFTLCSSAPQPDESHRSHRVESHRVESHRTGVLHENGPPQSQNTDGRVSAFRELLLEASCSPLYGPPSCVGVESTFGKRTRMSDRKLALCDRSSHSNGFHRALQPASEMHRPPHNKDSERPAVGA